MPRPVTRVDLLSAEHESGPIIAHADFPHLWTRKTEITARPGTADVAYLLCVATRLSSRMGFMRGEQQSFRLDVGRLAGTPEAAKEAASWGMNFSHNAETRFGSCPIPAEKRPNPSGCGEAVINILTNMFVHVELYKVPFSHLAAAVEDHGHDRRAAVRDARDAPRRRPESLPGGHQRVARRVATHRAQQQRRRQPRLPAP